MSYRFRPSPAVPACFAAANTREVGAKNGGGESGRTVVSHALTGEPDPNLLAFVLPLLAYLFLGGIAPKFGGEAAPAAAGQYLGVLLAQVLVVGGLLVYFRRIYVGHFPFRLDVLGLVIGGVGVVVWIGLCQLGWEAAVAQAIGREEWLPERAGVNPWSVYQGRGLVAFLVLRFTMLVVVVPVAEELFVRGWLARAVESADWHRVSLGQMGWRGLATVTLYGVLTHPAEALAAAAWFSLVSWLMMRTGKFWNCVLAHATTNGLLGIYVIVAQQWHLW